jgi:hypothetical protein
MRHFLRVFIAALAVLSLVTFSNPVVADMVQTPKGDPAAARGAALTVLEQSVRESGMGTPENIAGLRALPTADLLVLASASESAKAAGATYVIAVSVGAVIVVTAVVVLIIILVVHHHRYH